MTLFLAHASGRRMVPTGYRPVPSLGASDVFLLAMLLQVVCLTYRDSLFNHPLYCVNITLSSPDSSLSFHGGILRQQIHWWQCVSKLLICRLTPDSSRRSFSDWSKSRRYGGVALSNQGGCLPSSLPQDSHTESFTQNPEHSVLIKVLCSHLFEIYSPTMPSKLCIEQLFFIIRHEFALERININMNT
jgi:hypothetical protein